MAAPVGSLAEYVVPSCVPCLQAAAIPYIFKNVLTVTLDSWRAFDTANFPLLREDLVGTALEAWHLHTL